MLHFSISGAELVPVRETDDLSSAKHEHAYVQNMQGH